MVAFSVNEVVVVVMDIIRLASQSYFHLLFILIKIDFYALTFLCDVYNGVHKHM